MNNLQKERLLELLTDHTVFGLSEEEYAELERLKKEFPDWGKDFSLELTAAAIGLSQLDVKDELPANLREKIFASADNFFSQTNQSEQSVNFAAQARDEAKLTATEDVTNVTKFEPSRSSIWNWLGWAVAATACVALAINIWSTRPQPETVQNQPGVQTPTPKLSPAQERAFLLDATTDAVKIPLADPKNPKEILGEMVWSNSLQKGYARFNRLPANDVAKETYQFWIVDEAQNPKTPISGGVFDISTAGEAVVPMDPQLVVRKPIVIAVTKEKPGGVVVSAPERIVALAKI
jgi:anti-sigma-K factor RskA